MGIITAKYDGTCDKCKGFIKKGEKVCVEKGKKPLCAKCAPPDAKEFKGGFSKPVNAWDQFALKAMPLCFVAGGTTIKAAAEKAAVVADAMMAERAKRGIK